MITKFELYLKFEILKNILNNFPDNIDSFRFQKEITHKNKFIQILKDIKKLPKFLELTSNFKHYNLLFSKINRSSRNCLLKVAAYKIMGYRKVKLPIADKYNASIKELDSLLKREDEFIEHSFTFLPKFQLFDLANINYNLKLFGLTNGIAMTYTLEQYRDESLKIEAENDDVVLDLGGFYGETALYFAHKVNDQGKVYTFEFIPNNIANLHKNLALNPHLTDKIIIVENPVSDQSNISIFTEDNGPGTNIYSARRSANDIEFKTVSIDDFVNNNNLNKVDFIKMDIEGSELAALKGATETIKKYKPKLAISIYHKKEDPYEITKFIDSLNLDYKYSVNQFYLFPEEVILFAK